MALSPVEQRMLSKKRSGVSSPNEPGHDQCYFFIVFVIVIVNCLSDTIV